MQVSLFCLCIGREPKDLRFGIVNNETIYNATYQKGSEMFINELSNVTFHKVTCLKLSWCLHCFIVSCSIVNTWLLESSLGTKVATKESSLFLHDKLYMNWSEAYRRTKTSELWGFIDLSENFTLATIAR